MKMSPPSRTRSFHRRTPDRNCSDLSLEGISERNNNMASSATTLPKRSNHRPSTATRTATTPDRTISDISLERMMTMMMMQNETHNHHQKHQQHQNKQHHTPQRRPPSRHNSSSESGSFLTSSGGEASSSSAARTVLSKFWYDRTAVLFIISLISVSRLVLTHFHMISGMFVVDQPKVELLNVAGLESVTELSSPLGSSLSPFNSSSSSSVADGGAVFHDVSSRVAYNHKRLNLTDNFLASRLTLNKRRKNSSQALKSTTKLLDVRHNDLAILHNPKIETPFVLKYKELVQKRLEAEKAAQNSSAAAEQRAAASSSSSLPHVSIPADTSDLNHVGPDNISTTTNLPGTNVSSSTITAINGSKGASGAAQQLIVIHQKDLKGRGATRLPSHPNAPLAESSTTTFAKNNSEWKPINNADISEHYGFNYTREDPIQHAVFFNIFIPATPKGQENALRIVREQIEQIKNSYAASFRVSKGSFFVYYVTLGEDGVLTPSVMESFCGYLKCAHVDHFAEGSEVVTLAHAHKFCTLPEHENSKITYLHNKGSFHFNTYNENWRPILTDAALSELCVRRGLAESPCNLCGLQFYAMWTPFVPGNMFTATCQYVKKLIPPVNFSDAMEKAIGDVVVLRLKKQISTNLLPDRKDFFGLERYSDEHWIASHPEVVPCDCDQIGLMWKYHTRLYSLSNLSFFMSPHVDGSPGYYNKRTARRVSRNEDLRIPEYYYLAGNLVKWFSLYGKAPSSDSWAWKFFPDGNMWRTAVEKHGNQAVDIVTKKYTSEVIILDPTFPENPQARHVARPVGLVDSPLSSAVVFFDMAIPREAQTEEIAAKVQSIHDQLNVVAASPLVSKVYYVTLGHPALNDTDVCKLNNNSIPCVHLKHYNREYRGETIRHVHAYCKNNPTQRVAYLHNRLPAHITDKYPLLSRHLTKAATSDACLNALTEKDQCNVCGLQFFTKHTFHMAGGTWSASCSYINNLLEPETFVNRMQLYIKKVLIQKIWTRINFGIMKETPDLIGLDDYAMDHWIGSHPTILPCDLTDKLTRFGFRERQESFFTLRKGPRTQGLPFSQLDRQMEVKVFSTERLRMREFLYLAGNLLKWYILYESAPPPSSWAWSFFPDGEVWLNGVEKYGKSVVEAITSKYELSEVEIADQWRSGKQGK